MYVHCRFRIGLNVRWRLRLQYFLVCIRRIRSRGTTKLTCHKTGFAVYIQVHCTLRHYLISEPHSGWQRPIGCLKLYVFFRKRATKYRALLRKMTCKDKASYGSSPPFTVWTKCMLQIHSANSVAIALVSSIRGVHSLHTFTRLPSHCNTLQHTATHCNTLQHTATHCNTLQRTATHCNTLHKHVLYTICTVALYSHTPATHCNYLQHTATHCNTLHKHAFHTLRAVGSHESLWGGYD